ncbi:MAG TPA: hypothetical protein PLP64_00350 [Pseudothermotoga sp.]|nr:hypothetical protein [Pseudothermotoga sp.]HOK82667.1 hypothetical protein [Pseudothermotoga sp.]HPP70428.1 hypothetical protein [Pseudothermotoga sp.]
MVGRLIRALLILLILLTCSLIPVLLIKQHFTDDILKNSKLLVQATSKLVELQVLRKIEDSFRAPSQVPTHYIDLARKLGGLFFYDENSRKVVTCIRNEQEVQASLVSFDGLSAPATYFVTDTAGRIVATSESASLGGTLWGVIAITRNNEVFKTNYKGQTVFAYTCVNPVYGFSVTACVEATNIFWNLIIPVLVCLCTGLTILLIFIQDHYRSKILSIARTLEMLVEGSSEKITIRDRKISKIVDQINENIRRKEEVLHRTLRELENLKRNLEKMKGQKS